MRAVLRRALARRSRARLPAHGYEPGPNAPNLEDVGQAQVDMLNELLPWACFTVDGLGRRIGTAASATKRNEPQPIPDRRIVLMDERFGLSGATVLEVGCFEGVHTIGLMLRGADVLAVDARVENAVKTLARCWAYGLQPTVRVVDLEEDMKDSNDLRRDLVHHVGVLYHLTDPVRHVSQLGQVAGRGLMLDTHVATESEATSSYVVDGVEYRYRRYEEGGRADPFSGMRDHAKWLLLDDLVGLVRGAGFSTVDIEELRDERNGQRVLLFANR